MDRDEAREFILDQEPTFLQEAKARVNGQKTYICPCCQNGAGRDGTGIALDINNRTKKSYKCFKCGLYEDVIGLWKASRGVVDDKQTFDELHDYYNITIDTREPAFVFPNEEEKEQKIDTSRYPNYPTEQEQEQEQDFTLYFAECQSRLKDTSYLIGRGISTETAGKYGVGYDPQWKHPSSKYNYTQEAVIIPTSKTSYVARLVVPYIDRTGKATKVMKVGKQSYFNNSALYSDEQPVWIVEGEIDALSILESGGQALALGSASNTRKLIECIKERRPKKPLILALDNDEAGRQAQELTALKLNSLKVAHISADTSLLFNGVKDPNDAIQADKEGLISRCRQVEAQALEEWKRIEDLKNEEYFKKCGHTVKDVHSFIDNLLKGGDTPYIPTGFFCLDQLLDGGLYEGLYIVGAISSLGKTSFVLQLADQIAQAGTDILFLSLEMARTELYSKSISRLTALKCAEEKIPMSNAKTNRGVTSYSKFVKYSETEKVLVKNCIINYFNQIYPHFYIYEGLTGGDDLTVAKIRYLVNQHIKATGNKPVVLVDYLQIIAPADPKATDKQITDYNVKELKRISRDFKTPVIAISSFNRENYREKVSMLSFKESGAIEYSSDVLIGLQLKGAGEKGFDVDKAKSANPREVVLKILKNRNGKTGTEANFKYYPFFSLYEE